eukprot:363801-Chlamydomonas_euryale.AAC.11
MHAWHAGGRRYPQSMQRPCRLSQQRLEICPCACAPQEMMAEHAEASAREAGEAPVYNVGELMNQDEELQKLHEDRISQLKSEREKRVEMQRVGHGQVTEVTEGDFLEVVTNTDKVVVHFFHRDFERCKIMNKHLEILARKHFETRFIKMSAPVSARDMGAYMRVLPHVALAFACMDWMRQAHHLHACAWSCTRACALACICTSSNTMNGQQGYKVALNRSNMMVLSHNCLHGRPDVAIPNVRCIIHRVVGFDGLGGVDDFETYRLEEQLIASGTVVPEAKPAEDEDRLDGPSGKVRKAFVPDSSDEDSDFDE